MAPINFEEKRLIVSRDVLLEESPGLRKDYLPDLEQSAGIVPVTNLHVTVLSRAQVDRIIEKYPKDNSYDLLVDALGELCLPALKYAHITTPRMFGWSNNGPRSSRYYVAFPLDQQGMERIRTDTRKILGHFGLSYGQRRSSPHVTLAKVGKNPDIARSLTEHVQGNFDRDEPITLEQPIVETNNLMISRVK